MSCVSGCRKMPETLPQAHAQREHDGGADQDGKRGTQDLQQGHCCFSPIGSRLRPQPAVTLGLITPICVVSVGATARCQARQEERSFYMDYAARRKTDHETADSRNRRPAVLYAGHPRRRRRHHRRRNRHQQAHALQPLSLQGRTDRGLPGAVASRRRPRPTSRRSNRSSAASTGWSAVSPARAFAAALRQRGGRTRAGRSIGRGKSPSPSRKAAGSGFAICCCGSTSPTPTALRRSSRCWSTARSRRTSCATIPRWRARQRLRRRFF